MARKRKQTATPAANLTDKQQAFINEYFLCGFNATQAAKRAGYSGDYATLRAIGSQNLAKVNIRTEIDRRMNEHAMTANEVIARLAAQARGDIADIVNENGDPDIGSAIARGTSGLIKKHTRADTQHGERVTVELYDAQAALTTLLKHLTLEAGGATDAITIRFVDDDGNHDQST